MKPFRLISLALAVLLLSACTGSQQGPASKRHSPRNIIFLIGDGMGLSQLSSAYYFGSSEPNFSRFKDIGLIKTSASSHKITDSAAGATAFSAGVKTYNGAIGMGADSSSVPSIVEELAAKGWKTGLVATSSITHATPASYYAHQKLRSMNEAIAVDLVHSPVDFVAAGGYQFFCRRTDSLNYLDSLSARGFRVDTTNIAQQITDKSKKPAYFMAPDGLPPAHLGRGDFLSQATARALEYLGNDKAPFFLMIEGSQIDWGGHDNNGEYVIKETLDFDLVIGQVLDFAEKDGNTLVVVTADHETGGFTLASETKTDSLTGISVSDYDKIVTTFSTGGHSTTLIPVFAWGKGSERFRGVYENTEIYHLMKVLAGL